MQPPPLPKSNGNTQYVVAVVVMALLGVTAILGIILLRPAQDNTALIGTVVGLLMPTTLSLLALLKSQETHLAVNSRLDAFMRSAQAIGRAEGVTEGRAERASEIVIAKPIEPANPGEIVGTGTIKQVIVGQVTQSKIDK